jgi:hypothetical protein
MLTRSQTRKLEEEVKIDFDEASAAWKANKMSKGNGTYRYICQGVTKAGKKCLREPVQGSEFCKCHQKQKMSIANKIFI